MSDANFIELDNIGKIFSDGEVLIENMSLSIEKGQFVTLLGPSGCGKTTLLRMIGGFDKPTSGSIRLNGKDITNDAPNDRPVNTVFQKYALFPHLNVYDNIAFGLKLRKLDKKTCDEKVKKVLEMVDLEGFEKRSISTLSGGQQQRIAIARAIVNEPEVLLLDECLSALDAKMRKEMQLELKEMHKKLGITFIFVTHDQEEALTMSDKVVVMSDGEIQQIGTPEEIYNEPANLFVADFIGESNIFRGKMREDKKAAFAGTVFQTVDDYEAGTQIDAIVRPEDVMLLPEGQGRLNGTVYASTFKGTFYIVNIETEKTEFEAHSLKCYKPGDVVGIDILPDNIHIIPYDKTINHYECVVTDVTDDMATVKFDDFELKTKVSRFDKPSLVKAGTKVVASFNPDDADLSDNIEEGIVDGHIISFIFVDNLYNYTVRSESEEDYFVNDEDLWNQGDHVSIVIPEDKFVFTVKEKE